MKKGKILQYLIVAIVVIVAVYKWIGDSDNNSEISKNLKICVGEIYDQYSSFPENQYVKYRYFVHGKTFEAKMQVGTLSKKCNYRKNDKFKVEYSSLDPQKSRIVLDCKLLDTLSINSPPELILCVDCE